MQLTHINQEGRARMVDVTSKDETRRVARAEAVVCMQPQTLQRIKTGGISKGDVLAVAQVAGIMAAKKTPDLIPMCHPLMLTGVDIFFDLSEADSKLVITAEVSTVGKTGVEMEAITAASVAALTVYDMCKAIDRWITITGIKLLEKSGGKSGHLIREPGLSAGMHQGEVVAVSISPERGQLKRPIMEGRFIADFGLENDGHGGDWNRQVSLLAEESINRAIKERHLQVGPGDFAENIITRGLDLVSLPVGSRLRVGNEAILEITQIGKEDHESVVTRTLGFSLIPREGAFARVIGGGTVRAGDLIEVID